MIFNDKTTTLYKSFSQKEAFQSHFLLYSKRIGFRRSRFQKEVKCERLKEEVREETGVAGENLPRCS